MESHVPLETHGQASSGVEAASHSSSAYVIPFRIRCTDPDRAAHYRQLGYQVDDRPAKDEWHTIHSSCFGWGYYNEAQRKSLWFNDVWRHLGLAITMPTSRQKIEDMVERLQLHLDAEKAAAAAYSNPYIGKPYKLNHTPWLKDAHDADLPAIPQKARAENLSQSVVGHPIGWPFVRPPDAERQADA
jgi:hypothetical protein